MARKISLFCWLGALLLLIFQIGNVIIQTNYHVEFIDSRLFYSINLLLILLLSCSVIIHLRTKRWIMVAILLFACLIGGYHIYKMVEENQTYEQIIHFSPNKKEIFLATYEKNSQDLTYYRRYYYVFKRPKEIIGENVRSYEKVEWLTNDIAVLPYINKEKQQHVYVGTYGDRGSGSSYYYVGSELHGEWSGDGMQISVTPDGIAINKGTDSFEYGWEATQQYGTLALVLSNEETDEWVIGLGESFVATGNGTHSANASIVLYNPSNNKRIILHYKES